MHNALQSTTTHYDGYVLENIMMVMLVEVVPIVRQIKYLFLHPSPLMLPCICLEVPLGICHKGFSPLGFLGEKIKKCFQVLICFD